MIYRVNCYALEHLTESHESLDAESALDRADAFVAAHCWGAAHILAEGTTAGIYIARPSDVDRLPREARLTRLRQTEWS